MKTFISLLLVSVLLTALIVSPFFPGPPNGFVIGLSSLSLSFGFFGLLLVPVGIIWAIAEWMKHKQKEDKPVNWKPSFYLSIITTVIVTGIGLIYIPLLVHYVAIIAAATVFVLEALVLNQIIKWIKTIKSQPSRAFNPVPLYLIVLPLIAFTANKYLVEPMSNYSRNIAIKKSEILIHAIEEYKNVEGVYPESLESLKGKYIDEIPQSSVMGVTHYRYAKLGEDFTLVFSQWKDGGALEEIVAYDRNPILNKDYTSFNFKLDRHRALTAFASYDAGIKHWRYYLCD